VGGAAAGALVGTALGVPVVGTGDWRAVWRRNWCSKKAEGTQTEVGGCINKKEGNDKKAIDEAKNEAGQYPQSYQEDDCQKANAESQ
jgi:hypothetical protein